MPGPCAGWRGWDAFPLPAAICCVGRASTTRKTLTPSGVSWDRRRPMVAALPSEVPATLIPVDAPGPALDREHSFSPDLPQDNADNGGHQVDLLLRLLARIACRQTASPAPHLCL